MERKAKVFFVIPPNCSIFANKLIKSKMKFAIIAAGEGSRLASEGIQSPKPLVTIGGEPLIDRLLRVFMQNGATDILVLCNGIATEVSRHLVEVQNEGLHGRPIPLRFYIKTTPSSMHSFYELSQHMENDDPFILTTVDTIFREDEFSEYVKAFNKEVAAGLDGVMGVTGFVDDEKPLYVGTDSEMSITGFYDEKEDGVKYVSAGIYGLTAKTIETLRNCIGRGESRMRNFQRALVADGRHLKAWEFSKVFDIDHKKDIAKAEEFIKSRTK